MGGELYPEHMAWSMADSSARRAELAADRRDPFIADAEYVGFPAILGMTDTAAVAQSSGRAARQAGLSRSPPCHRPLPVPGCAPHSTVACHPWREDLYPEACFRGSGHR